LKLNLKEVFLALISGLLTALSFPKFSFSFLIWISFIPLLFVIYRKKTKKAFLLGFIAGFANYALLIYWIPSVPAHYGNVPYFLSFLIFILFISILALFWASFAWLFAFFSSYSPRFGFIISPFIWVSLEYILTYFLTGFPWCLVGYAQYRNLYLIQIASITGVYGVSFIILLFNSYFVLSIKERKRRPFIIAIIITAIVYLYGFYCLEKSFKNEDALRVGIIQGNVPSEINWQELTTREILNLFNEHLLLTIKASSEGAKLVIWPEFTVPFCLSCPEPIQLHFKNGLFNLCKKKKIYVLIGSIEMEENNGKINYYNSALLLSEKGILSRYSKIHLVPFGEYVPFKKILFFVEKISHAIGELTPGRSISLHEFNSYKFASPICYEIIFPNLVRKFVKKGANFLVTITNDGWYGRSSAPYQHFSMAVLRAVENRRYLVRSATTGVSGIIDPYGRIIKKSKLMTKTFLVTDIYALNKKTFYTLYGDRFAFICIGITISLLIGNFIRKIFEKLNRKI
jgi:apolipoprotein N-acyltransferase